MVKRRLNLEGYCFHKYEVLRLQKALRNASDSIQVVLVSGPGLGSEKSTLIRSAFCSNGDGGGASRTSIASRRRKESTDTADDDSMHYYSNNNNNCYFTSASFDKSKQHNWTSTLPPLEVIRQLLTELYLGTNFTPNEMSALHHALIDEALSHVQKEMLLSLLPQEARNSFRAVSAADALLGTSTMQSQQSLFLNGDGGEITEYDMTTIDETCHSADGCYVARSNTNSYFEQDALSILKHTFQTFLRAVSKIRTVILCLGNMMWVDEITLDVFKFLLLDTNLKNLIFCITYQDNEVDDMHPLANWIETVKLFHTENNVTKIILENVTSTDIKEFLIAGVRISEKNEEVTHLAELLQERTNGDVSYLLLLMEQLQDLKLLNYDVVNDRSTFSFDKIQRNTSFSDNVGNVLASKVSQLPRGMQDILKLASCFGAKVSLNILELTYPVIFAKDSTSMDDIERLLGLACQQKFLIQISVDRYKFSNDQVLSKAYALLQKTTTAGDDEYEENGDNDEFNSKNDKNKEIHWQLGKALLSKVNRSFLDDEIVFECCDQLQQGLDYCITKEDNVKVAEMTLFAGTRAASTSAFLPATKYLSMGIKVLMSNKLASASFEDHYNLSVKLYNLLSQTQYCCGKIKESKQTAELVIKNAQAESHKTRPKVMLVSCLVAVNSMNEAIEIGLGVLERLGEKIPRKPNKTEVKHEMRKLKAATKGKKDADTILSLPRMKKKSKKLCIGVLHDLYFAANKLGETALEWIIVSRLVCVTLQYGHTLWSPFVFALIGADTVAKCHDISEAREYARVATALVRKGEVSKGIPSVVRLLGVAKPASECLDLALEGHKALMRSGDILNAGLCINVYCTSFFYSGLPFNQLLNDIEKYSTLMLEYGQKYMFFSNLPLWQCLLSLSGRHNRDSSNIEIGDAVKLATSKMAIEDAIELADTVQENDCGFYKELMLSYEIQIAFYIGEIEKATRCYEQLRDSKNNIMMGATMIDHCQIFFFALICIANAKKVGISRKQKWSFKKNAKKYIDVLRSLVKNGGINLVHKLQLLNAEMATLDKKQDPKTIHRSYDLAIASAMRSGFLQDGALANFLCAQYCMITESLNTSAEAYLTRSYSVYKNWGAIGVSESLQKQYPDILQNLDTFDCSKRDNMRGAFRSRSQFSTSFVRLHKTLSRSGKGGDKRSFLMSQRNDSAMNLISVDGSSTPAVTPQTLEADTNSNSGFRTQLLAPFFSMNSKFRSDRKITIPSYKSVRANKSAPNLFS